MSKKTKGFKLINNDFSCMLTCTSLLHELSSGEIWSLCRVLYITCQNKTFFRSNQFIDVRCQNSWIFQCKGFRKRLLILQRDSIIENSFSKVSKLFPHITQNVLLVILQGCFKKAGIQFKCNNVLRNED